MNSNEYGEWLPSVVTIIFIVILIGIVILLAKFSNKRFENIKSEKTMSSNSDFISKIIIIEGCEYLAFKDNDGVLMITHKGNCNNPIHLYRVEK